MELNLKPPIFIIPEFQGSGRAAAEKAGLIFGPVAHYAYSRDDRKIPNRLVQVPEGWSMGDDRGVSSGEQDGFYLLDEHGRRRIRFGDMNAWNCAEAEIICRFAIQEWQDGKGWKMYVRKVVGGETNIYRYPYAHVVFETQAKESPDENARKICQIWLRDHYTKGRDPLAYWDVA